MFGAGDENPGAELNAGAGDPNVEEEVPKPEEKPGVLPVPKGELIPNPKADELA